MSYHTQALSPAIIALISDFDAAAPLATDSWTLNIISTDLNTLNRTTIPLIFLSNGSIDTIRTSQTDLASATALLAPAINSLQVGSPPFNFWELINFIVVSFYWLALFDLGQIYPFVSPTSSIHDNTTTTNIFVNETRFSLYSSYLLKTVIPLVNHWYADEMIPPNLHFNPLNETNRLWPEVRTFIRSYSCELKGLKPVISLIAAVVVADYALIRGGYHLGILIAGTIQRGRDKNGTDLMV